MEGNNTCSDQVIAEMIEMGFEYSNIVEAIEEAGLSVPSVVEHILNTPKLQEHNKNPQKTTFAHVRQSKIFDHFHSNDVQEHTEDFPDPIPFVLSEPFQVQDSDVASDWERKVSNLMQKHFVCLFLWVCNDSLDCSYEDDIYSGSKHRGLRERPNLKVLVVKIRQQYPKFLTTDILWWRGLARLLEIKGFIREGDDKIHVQVKYPEPTELGMEFVKSMSEQDFYVYPEADMLLTRKSNKPFSSFSEWGRGWADPEIRRQRLEKMNLNKKPKMLPSPKNKRQRRRKGKKWQSDLRTSRGRLVAKLTKFK